VLAGVASCLEEKKEGAPFDCIARGKERWRTAKSQAFLTKGKEINCREGGRGNPFLPLIKGMLNCTEKRGPAGILRGERVEGGGAAGGCALHQLEEGKRMFTRRKRGREPLLVVGKDESIQSYFEGEERKEDRDAPYPHSQEEEGESSLRRRGAGGASREKKGGGATAGGGFFVR